MGPKGDIIMGAQQTICRPKKGLFVDNNELFVDNKRERGIDCIGKR